MIRVAINGFGRIGRVVTRALDKHPNIQLIAINDLANTDTLAHLIKYDSVHGKFNGEVTHNDTSISLNGNVIITFQERDPANLPWKELNIDIVVESTGLFLTKELAQKHITAGAKKVIISAPAKGTDIKTVVLGVNDDILSTEDQIISNASCTTNAAAPLIKILNELGDIERAFISTVHSYTNDQGLHDAPHKDLRRARAGAISIVPTSTGAAKALTKIFPKIEGKIEGYALRVPVPDGSLIDITAFVNKDLTVETINAAFKKAADTNLKGILEYTTDEIVSIDIVGNTHSCIFDSKLTVTNGNMVKVVGWYDNEVGYSNRVVDLIEKIGR
ncbi:MAG: type I glyceraldehyde-3-phosphate dehydrogenase [Flavobacteriales bacterium CG_4_10_14_0_2_um_filter_32_8]|nr:MAG: type I glyceraldehyde-3-phosphate dehydrogenase [Flavobacteriales bacterium CG_4_10_14_0_2_um_filter_32_8]PJB15895.1 MAG: type I glyceraldehyde-3-phosphate dehydrogenase [Flavobacteriales bacterium CG_4_9_14_3_um_filter_32_8]